ncbi:MAG: hypothetical protein EBS94_02615 [Proteobacteria bacterium]|nr:hypothetical protein [Pseudomonadota bacterium]
MNSDFDIVRIVDNDEEDTSLVPLVTENDAWEYGAELPEIEVTPEQLDSAEALYMRDIRRYNLLTAQEEVELAEKREDGEYASERLKGVKHGDPERVSLERRAREGASARRRLIECNLRLSFRRATSVWTVQSRSTTHARGTGSRRTRIGGYVRR